MIDEGKHYICLQVNEHIKRDDYEVYMIEVISETVGQYVGTGNYGQIYEGMEVYDEYTEEFCTIEYDEERCSFCLIYDGNIETIESLDGLRILHDKEE